MQEDERKPLTAALNGKQMKSGIGKNPAVDTNFLPDREREAAEERLRQQLRKEYELRQQVCKAGP